MGNHVGFLGGIVALTDVEGILRWDCVKTDFYRGKAYPTYLYYNPHGEAREVTMELGQAAVDVYEAVGHTFLARNRRGRLRCKIGADRAVVLVLSPAGGKAQREGKKLLVDGVVVDYAAGK